MQPPSLVLFDMDGVLCAYSIRARAGHLARLSGSTPQAVYDAIWASGLEARGDDGTLGAEAYLRGCGERIGYRLTLDDWLDARRTAMAARPEVLDLVRRVRARARVAVLTNNSTLIADHIARLLPELPPLFGTAIFASAGLRAVKPEAACYHRCLAALGVAPGDALFVDDHAENVAGAERAGLLAHHYISPQALAELLRGHGLL